MANEVTRRDRGDGFGEPDAGAQPAVGGEGDTPIGE
jgi:hypothetical protein